MLYKILNEDGSVYHHGGSFRWPLPTKNDDGTWTPGEWTEPVDGELVACSNGYHLCREMDLLGWLGPAIFEAEYEGECIEAENKLVVRRARLLRQCEGWNVRTARLFACDCAERVLALFEAKYPGDSRPRSAIEVARRYANGETTDEELAAARAAAWDAARAAAWAATWAAARAAAWDAARAAAWAATWAAVRAVTRDAARAAAWAAARAAAWDAERRWQLQQLSEIVN